MATKLGEAYLELRIKEKLAAEMKKARAEIERENEKASMLASRVNIRNQRKAIAERESEEKRSEIRKSKFYSMVATRSRVNRARGERHDDVERKRRETLFSMIAKRSRVNAVRAERQESDRSDKQRKLNTLLAHRRRINLARTERQESEKLSRAKEVFSLLAQRRRVNRERTERQAQERKDAIATNSRRAKQFADQQRRQFQTNQRLTAVRNRQAMGQIGMAGGAMSVASTAVLASGLDRVSQSMQQMFMRGLDVNTTLDRQRIVLTQLTGSAAVANKMLGELVDLDVKTPFNIKDLSVAARMLKATGVIGDKEVIPMVRKLADAAAGSGGGPESLQHITLAISQMLSKGKIQSEEMTRQLSNAGIPAWKLLADAMGKSVGEVQKLSEDGKLGLTEINMLIDAMGSKYEGLAEKLGAGSIGDAFGVLSSKFDLLLAQMTQPFKAPFIESVKSLLDGMSSPLVAGIAASVGDMVGMMGRAAQFFATNPFGQAIAAFSLMATGMALVTASLGGFVAAAIAFPVVLVPLAAIVGMAPQLMAVAAAVTAVGASFVAAFNSKHGERFRATLSEIYELLKETASLVMGNFLTAFKMAGQLLAAFFTEGDNLSNWQTFADVLREVLNLASLWGTAVKVVLQEIRPLFDEMLAKIREFMSELRMVVSVFAEIAKENMLVGLSPFGHGIGKLNDFLKYLEMERERERALNRSAEAARNLKAAMAGIFGETSKGGTSTWLRGLGAMKDALDKAVEDAGGPKRAAKEKAAKASIWQASILPWIKNQTKGGGALAGGLMSQGMGVGGMISRFLSPDSVKMNAMLNKMAEDDRESEFKKKAEEEHRTRKRVAELSKTAPAAIAKLWASGGGMLRDFNMKSVGSGIAGLAGALAGGAKGAGGGIAGMLAAAMSGGEKGKGGFVGIADMSRQIQEAIINSDETKDRKAMVKHLGGIDKGVEAVKGVIGDAVKWIGKAL